MSIFSDVKDTVKTQIETLFTAASLTVTVKKYRTFDWSVATNGRALVMLSTSSHDEETADAGLRDYVDIIASTVVRYGNETEAATAETMLDDIEQIFINAYRSDGTHQATAGKWRAVNFYQPSARSPFNRESETGNRYSEKYLRFYI